MSFATTTIVPTLHLISVVMTQQASKPPHHSKIRSLSAAFVWCVKTKLFINMHVARSYLSLKCSCRKSSAKNSICRNTAMRRGHSPATSVLARNACSAPCCHCQAHNGNRKTEVSSPERLSNSVRTRCSILTSLCRTHRLR